MLPLSSLPWASSKCGMRVPRTGEASVPSNTAWTVRRPQGGLPKRSDEVSSQREERKGFPDTRRLPAQMQPQSRSSDSEQAQAGEGLCLEDQLPELDLAGWLRVLP